MAHFDPGDFDDAEQAKRFAAGMAASRRGYEDDGDGDPPDRTPGRTLFITAVVMIALLVGMLILILKVAN